MSELVILRFDAFAGYALADAFALVERHDVQVEQIQGGKAMMATVRSALEGTALSDEGTIWGADLRTSSKMAETDLVVSGGGHEVRLIFG